MRSHAFQHPGSFVRTQDHQKDRVMTDARKINHLFQKELVVISMGLDSFADTLRKENVKVLQMNWKPPAGGDRTLISLLERLEK
jgi:hypothetical protein